MTTQKTKLPEGWQEVELGDSEFFEILSSGIEKFEGEKDYLSTESIQATKIEKIEAKITFKNRPSRANMQPVLNSVWFAKMQATLKVYVFDENNKDEIKKYILSTGFAGIRCKENKVYPKYLKYFFITNEFNKIKDSLCSGATQKGIRNEEIAKIKIPLPPIETQKKIVAILEKAEKLKEKREQAIKLADEYLKSVFAEMFLKEKDKFEEVELEEVTEIIMGQSPPGNSYNERKKGMPFFQGKAEFTEKYPIVKKWTTYPLKIAEPNSILISVRAPVGDVNINKIKSCIGRGLASIKPSKNISVEYLFYFFIYKKNQIENLGAGSTFKAITSKQLKSIKIPLPPIELQQKFASIVEKVEKLKEKQLESKKKIDEMFNSLMQKAFRGELVK
ncbi:MAG: restriction endonuclease subunit S [Candidatus Pacearchaeota archaeon]